MVDTPAPSAAPGRVTIEDGVAWLVLDDPAKRVNTLSLRMFDWFSGEVGRRLAPAELLKSMAAAGGTFHQSTIS